MSSQWEEGQEDKNSKGALGRGSILCSLGGALEGLLLFSRLDLLWTAMEVCWAMEYHV